jgi:hypothetical protein
VKCEFLVPPAPDLERLLEVGKHSWLDEPATPDVCERNPEYCTHGYRHFGPCPPPPSSVDTTPGIPPVLEKERAPEVPGKAVEDKKPDHA